MRYLVTAALPYANGPLHIGHIAGCYLPADIYVRYLRLINEDVKFICGSDEHGVPITIKARNEGVTPQQVVDKYHSIMKNSFAEFGISFDIYSRTTNKVHHETAQAFFKKLYDDKVFTEEITEQYYDEEVKQFLADRYIEGTCPRCGFARAYGDQCENCGSSLNPTDLINPVSKLSGKAPVLRKTKNWFLPLNKFEKDLKKWIGSHQEDWKVNVYGQCMSWLNTGLQPRAMTRDLDWGVKVPLPDTEGKVLDVWFDAPIGYISATKELFEKEAGGRKQEAGENKLAIGSGQLAKEKKEEENKTSEQLSETTPLSFGEGQGGEVWEQYWKQQPNPKDNPKLIHFIGKDNIVFHCLIFPAMLNAHGDYVLPTNVPANEFLNLEGDKISTSRNWAVWLHEYLIDFKDKQDVLRYVLCATAPETKDNDFTWRDFQARNNNELVAVFGNFVNRTLVLTQKYFEGKVPPHHKLTDADQECISAIQAAKRNISDSIEKFRFREALNELMTLARVGNKYLADTEPWKVYKTDPQRVETILYIALEITAYLAALCEPFLPHTSASLYTMLNLEKLNWAKDLKGQILKPGHVMGEVKLLFEKIEDEMIEKQVDKLHASKEVNAIQEAGSRKQEAVGNKVDKITKDDSLSLGEGKVSYDDFSKMDLRVATIIAAEKVEKADKLLKLTLDTGIDQRTVVSGIALHYKPEEIIGQRVTLLANLAPRKIRGIESKGMILMAENEKGELCFIAPTKDFANGSGIS